MNPFLVSLLFYFLDDDYPGATQVPSYSGPHAAEVIGAIFLPGAVVGKIT
ncbi:MAG TPA: hypothetical protein VGG64_17340 [Pirellulales bacterium]|jgi:hypothetical protein